MTTLSLNELAQRFGLTLVGEGHAEIRGVCALSPGAEGCISFLSNPRLRSQLTTTAAAAVIVGNRDVAALGAIPGLVAPDPYLAYARIAQLFDPDRAFTAGRHEAAVIADDAEVGEAAMSERWRSSKPAPSSDVASSSGRTATSGAGRSSAMDPG